VINDWRWIILAYDTTEFFLLCRGGFPRIINEIFGVVLELRTIFLNVKTLRVRLLEESNWRINFEVL